MPLRSGWVGSDDLGYGPGSDFSFEPVQTSSYEPVAGLKHVLSKHALCDRSARAAPVQP